jgi:hypothetical protein
MIHGPFLCEINLITVPLFNVSSNLYSFSFMLQSNVCNVIMVFNSLLASYVTFFVNQTERYIKLPSQIRSSGVEYSLLITVMIKTSHAEGATGDASHSVPRSNFLWCWSSCLYFSVSVVVPPPSGSHERVIYIIDFRKIPRCR